MWCILLLLGVVWGNSDDSHFCVSCASSAYLPVWPQLMRHYFPPKNFSDSCWHPTDSMGTVECRSACFTLIEDFSSPDIPQDDTKGVLRGCVDRLLLFGMDEDIRDQFSSLIGRTHRCRRANRKIFHLRPLGDNDIVTMCSCTAEKCNNVDMFYEYYSASASLSACVIPFLFLLF